MTDIPNPMNSEATERKMNRRWSRLPVISSITFLFVTLHGSTHAAEWQAEDARSTPNIILILCDDAGFSDFGFSGGISQTPVLDTLAREGVFFTRAYNNARCTPTRASLMTGICPNVSGWEPLSASCVTIPEMLQSAGYATYMVGKWHLGTGKSVDPESGAASTPKGRGFDRFYGIWSGVHNVSKAKILEGLTQAAKGKEKKSIACLIDDSALAGLQKNGEDSITGIIDEDRPIPFKELPDNYYNTITWTDKAIEFIQSTLAKQPFFLYVAHTVPHWPLDPKPESIERFKGKFDEGWDVLRAKILENQKRLGIVDASYPMPPLEYGVPPVAEAHSNNIDKFKKDCAIYYAAIAEMDEQIGRLLNTVKQMGREQNTIVVFLSDNGADDVIGGKPRGNMSNMPYMGFKFTYYDGGCSTPLLVKWPGVVKAGTINRRQHVVVEDMMPTLLEIAGAVYPTEFKGQRIHPMEGRSFFKALGDPGHADPARTWCWEHDGQRGVWQDPWKAVMLDNRHLAVGKAYYAGTKDGWFLYRLDGNRVESQDLARENPEQLKSMIEVWNEWAKSKRWTPSGHFGGLHSTGAANGIQDYGDKQANSPWPVSKENKDQ